MKVISKIFTPIIYSNVLLAFGAAIAMWGTADTFNIKLAPAHYILMLFACLSLYSFHWYLTPIAMHEREREQWSVRHRETLLILSIIALIAGLVFLGNYLQLKQIFFYVPLVVFSFIYTAPKIPYKPFTLLRKYINAKTLYLTLGWWYATALLPLLLADVSTYKPYSSYLWYRFLLIFTICFLFDYRDRKLDISAGIKTILNFVKLPLASFIMQALLALCCVALTNLYDDVSLVAFIFNVIPVVFLVFAYEYSIHKGNDIWYYGILDSLLFITALLQLIVKVF